MIRRELAILGAIFCVLLASLLSAVTTAGAEEPKGSKFNPKLTSCKMVYNLKGWSLVVKTTKGEGRIDCDNGQKASVEIKSWGGGFTIGKSEVIGGKGKFSEVRDISDLYGSYAQAEASAGATKGGGAQVLTMGEVSLALAGSSQGVDIGVSIGRFDISPE